MHVVLWFPGCVKFLRCLSSGHSSAQGHRGHYDLVELFYFSVFFLCTSFNSVCPLCIVQFILVEPTLTSFPRVVKLNTHIFPINRKSINSAALHCSWEHMNAFKLFHRDFILCPVCGYSFGCAPNKQGMIDGGGFSGNTLCSFQGTYFLLTYLMSILF